MRQVDIEAQKRLEYVQKISNRSPWVVPDTVLGLLRDLQVLPGIRDRARELLGTLMAHQQDNWILPASLSEALGSAQGMHRVLLDIVRDIGTLLDTLQEEPNLAAPETPVWWDGDPDFAGLVPRDQQDIDMPITILPWINGAPDPGRFDTLIIEWKDALSDTWTILDQLTLPGPINEQNPPPIVTLSKEWYEGHGDYDLRYRVVAWNASTGLSFPIRLRLDRIPPNNGGQAPADPIFDDGALDGVTEAYLGANDDKLVMTIPVYHDEQLGDTVQVFISGAGYSIVTPVVDGPLEAGRTVSIPGDQLRRLPDSYLYVEYRILDKVTNATQHSEKAVTGLLLKPLPTMPLALPIVELAADDGLIDLMDVRATTRLVAVPLYGNWQSMDSIVVTWGGVDVRSYVLGATPSDPLIIDIPYEDVLIPAYGANTGPVATAVSYKVVRGPAEFDSPELTINVDLSVPGPENPNRPDPINPNLPSVTVFGGTDSNQSNPNKLVLADVGLDAELVLTLYTPIGAGERLWFYWGSRENPLGTFDPQVGQEGDPVSLDVPWSVIAAYPGSDRVPVFYDIGLVAGDGNLEQSPVTEVDVIEALPVVLGAPTFPDRHDLPGGPLLNCDSFLADDPDNPTDYYVRVQFPADPMQLSAGDKLDIVWQGYTDPDGMNPLPNTFTLEHTLSQDDVDNGFIINVTGYLTYIEPIGFFGSATVTYTLQGTTVEGEASIEVTTVRPGGACYILPPAR